MTPYYRVGTRKLAILSLCTFGGFGIYWSYRQWSAEREAHNEKFSAGFRAFFGIFTAFALFPRIHATLTADGDQPGFSPDGYAIAYLALAMAWRLPDPFNLLGLFWFVPIVPIQAAINANARKHDPQVSLNETWEWWAFLLCAAGAVLLLLSIVGTLFPYAGE